MFDVIIILGKVRCHDKVKLEGQFEEHSPHEPLGGVGDQCWFYR